MRRTSRSSTAGSLQLALRRDGEQLFVRDCCSRGNTTAATPDRDRRRGSSCPGRAFAGVRSNRNTNFGLRDDRLHRHANAALEAAFLAPFLVVVHQEISVGVGRRAAERSAGQPRDDRLRAGRLFLRSTPACT